MENVFIAVRYENDQLTIESPRATIPGSSDPSAPLPMVIWAFEGSETLEGRGYTPAIVFEGDFTGPFVNFCQMPGEVIGSGNTGRPGVFTYHAVLLAPAGGTEPSIRSDAAELKNQVAMPGADTSPFVEVSVVPEGDGHLLKVGPQAAARKHGQTLVWRIVNEVPSVIGAWFPRVVFEKGPDGMDPSYGPFESWQVNDSFVIGAGHRGAAGRYNYRFEVVSLTEQGVKIRSSPDPTVDDEGDPTGPPGGQVYGRK